MFKTVSKKTLQIQDINLKWKYGKNNSILNFIKILKARYENKFNANAEDVEIREHPQLYFIGGANRGKMYVWKVLQKNIAN